MSSSRVLAAALAAAALVLPVMASTPAVAGTDHRTTRAPGHAQHANTGTTREGTAVSAVAGQGASLRQVKARSRAAGRPVLNRLPSAVVAGRSVTVEGVLPRTGVRRVVELQYRAKRGTFTAVARTRSKPNGQFQFARVRLTATGSVRTHVAASGSRAAATGNPVRVRVRVPALSLTALPPLAQPGSQVSAPAEGSALAARVDPASAEVEVHFMRRADNGWVDAGHALSDEAGYAVTTVPAGVARYRAEIRDAAGRSVSTSPTARTRDWTLAWQDTFDGTALDPSKWVSQRREYVPNQKRSCWRASPQAVSVSGGAAHLGMQLDPELLGSPCSFDSGKVSGTTSHLLGTQIATQGTYSFQHGFAAARMRTQQARGMHSAFWTLPANSDEMWLAETQSEVDVMEFFGERGTGRDRIASFVHHRPVGATEPVKYGSLNPLTSRLLAPGQTWANSFHVFSVEWTPTEYIFRVDGKEHYREDRGMSEFPAMLVLSMQAADYEIGDLQPQDMGQHASVDWVRVWGL